MKYIKFTYVDTLTGIAANVEPTENGPKFPDIPELEFKWERSSRYPTKVPEFFGTCSDIVDVNTSGILDIITKESYDLLYKQELLNRKIAIKTASVKQIRLRLLKLNILDKINLTIKNSPQELQIEWDYSTELHSPSNLIDYLIAAGDLTDDLVEEIFMNEEDYFLLISGREEELLLIQNLESNK